MTTPAKEDDRVRQIEAVNAQTGPVMLAYPAAPEIDAMLARAAAGKPAVDVTADDGVRHQLWVIGDDAAIAALTRAVEPCPRSISPTAITARPRRCALPRRAAAKARTAISSPCCFRRREMTILDYNRVLRDLNGRTPGASCWPNSAALHSRAERRAGAAGERRRSRHGSRPAAGTA